MEIVRSSLYKNLNIFQDKTFLIILDYYHSDENRHLLDLHLSVIKETIPIDTQIIYLFFTKTQIDQLECFISNNPNVYQEDKLSNVHFLTGLSLGKDMTTYIFTDEDTKISNWLKLVEPYKEKVKFSEFSYFQITIEYLIREKKKQYEQIYGKSKSKLSQLLNNTLKEEKSTKKQDESCHQLKGQYDHITTKELPLVEKIVENIKNCFSQSKPNDFLTVFKIIRNFAEQNILLLPKGNHMTIGDLEFALFYQLLQQGVIHNPNLLLLIQNGYVKTIDELSDVFSLSIDNIVQKDDHTLTRKKPKSVKGNHVETNFTLDYTLEQEYINLITKCPSLCLYVKSVITKVLSSLSISNINKVPTTPSKFKNFINSIVNNQELYRISQNILNLNHEKVVVILTEGIMIEFLKNHLIVFSSSNRIHYDLNKIEHEKFRLTR